jgi:uncharacterized protein (DUF433 family)
MADLLERITINPKQCGGSPCIRGMRIRVSDVLDLFAAGLSAEEILEEIPDLEAGDLKAALLYESHQSNRPAHLAAMFTEFADEDSAIAEGGMSEYAERLLQEDQL